MQPQTMTDLQIKAGAKARLLPPPEKYMWEAVWWHLDARNVAYPEQHLSYARSQLRLAKDMADRPQHYRRKPRDLTDWQWSGLPSAVPSVRPVKLRQDTVEMNDPFWSARAPRPEPHAPAGARISDTEWEQLTPGMRRAITQEFARRPAAEPQELALEAAA